MSETQQGISQMDSATFGMNKNPVMKQLEVAFLIFWAVLA